MTKQVLILVATGSEEIETITPYDVLVRAGVKPTFASVGSHGVYVELSRGAKIVPDVRFDQVSDLSVFDAIVCPGGMPGAKTISEDPAVQKAFSDFYAQGKLTAAICAGSLVAKTSKIGAGKKLTSHPSVRDDLAPQYAYQETPVAVDGNLITSRGPGTALAFSLAIVEYLLGHDKALQVQAPMVLPVPAL